MKCQDSSSHIFLTQWQMGRIGVYVYCVLSLAIVGAMLTVCYYHKRALGAQCPQSVGLLLTGLAIIWLLSIAKACVLSVGLLNLL